MLGGVRRHHLWLLGEESGPGSHHELAQLGGAGSLLSLQHLKSVGTWKLPPKLDFHCKQVIDGKFSYPVRNPLYHSLLMY